MDKKANVFMITAATKSMIVQESINFGVRYCILKPFEHIIVKNIVGKVLNQSCCLNTKRLFFLSI